MAVHTFAQLKASISAAEPQTLTLLLAELDKMIDEKNAAAAATKLKTDSRTAITARDKLPPLPASEESKYQILYKDTVNELLRSTPVTTSLNRLIKKFRLLSTKYDLTVQVDQLRDKIDNHSRLDRSDPDTYDDVMADLEQMTESVNLNRLRVLSGLG